MREFVTYNYLSYITHIQVSWLKKNLPVEMAPEHIKGDQVDLQAFKGWLRKVRLLPLSQYLLYAGFSEGRRSPVTNKNHVRHKKIAHYLIPTTRKAGKYYVKREHAKPLLEAARETRLGKTKLRPKKYSFPEYIFWPKGDKPIRIHRLKKKYAVLKDSDRQTEMRYETDTSPASPSPTPPEPSTDPKPASPSPDETPDNKHPQVTVDFAHDLGEKMAEYDRPATITFRMPFGLELTFRWKN